MKKVLFLVSSLWLVVSSLYHLPRPLTLRVAMSGGPPATYHLLARPAFAVCECLRFVDRGVEEYRCSGECANPNVDCKGNASICVTDLPPTGPDDCPEGKTYVAIFRTCLDFGEFAGALINWLMIIAAGLAIIKIAAGGIQYIFASGDPKNLENAHATMTSAIVGLMLVLLAWVIMKIIGELTPESWQIRLLGG